MKHDILKIQMLILVISPQCEANLCQLQVCYQGLAQKKAGAAKNEKCRHMTNFHWFGFFHRFKYIEKGTFLLLLALGIGLCLLWVKIRVIVTAATIVIIIVFIFLLLKIAFII